MIIVGIKITQLDNGGDERGDSFGLSQDFFSFLGGIKNVHVTTLRSGQVRGNHYHKDSLEELLVVYKDKWSVHWDTGLETTVQVKAFTGEGAVLIQIPPLASHAIKNEGSHDLVIIGFTNREFNQAKPDMVRRVITG